jgi:hypothetical protein
MTNCTVAGNTVTGGAGGTGGSGPTHGGTGSPGGGSGGNICALANIFNLKNSILDSAVSGGNAYAGIAITDEGNNLSSDSTPSLTHSGSHNNSANGLGALANYGGPTLTMSIAANSPAVNNGDDSAAPATDQRGYFRTGTSDIGAYEYNGGLMEILALGQAASLDGNVGLFLVGGPGTGILAPATVNVAISGTASNGVDYVQVTNSYTMPAGSTYFRILVQGIPGAFAGRTNR